MKLIAAFGLLGVLACGAAPPADEAIDGAEIIGGRVDRTHRAVGQIGVTPRVASGDDEAEWICTGTAIAPKIVLTAAHCVTNGSRRISARRLRFETEGELARVTSAKVAPHYARGSDGAWDDLAVLALDREVDVDPIPIAGEAPEEGDEAIVVGFGVTRATGVGTGTGGGRRRRATITVDTVEPRELAYDAQERGACYGDSGGPLILRGEVIGVTSRGTAADCRDVDIATRVDAFAAWIDAAFE